MRFPFFIIIILTTFFIVSCKISLDVTTHGSDFDVPANTANGVDSWAEIKINLPDSVKNTDDTVTLHKFLCSYYLTNLSSSYAMSNSDFVMSLGGEAGDNEIKDYLDTGMGGSKPLFLRGSYVENTNFIYILKSVNIGIAQSIKSNSVSLSTNMIESILKQGYFYIDSKISVNLNFTISTNIIGFSTTFTTNYNVMPTDKLGIRNFQVNIQADKDTGSFLFLENIL